MNRVIEILTSSETARETVSDPKTFDTITLNETDRHRRRIVMISDGGFEFLLDLPKARLLRHGDVLVLDNSKLIEVLAEPEPLYRVSANDNLHLLQLAWQLGNRHLAAEITDKAIVIRRDHVIKDMLEGLGAKVEEIEAPFNPQGGAYDGDHQGHSHD